MWFALASLALSLAPLAAPARGQEERLAVTCPLDSTRVAAPEPRAWNSGGGVDSDGCRWSLDATGLPRVVGADDVVLCPGCGLAFEAARGDRPLAPAQAAAARAAVAADQAARGSPATAARRFERAALAWRAILAASPAATPDGEDPDEVAGTLLLRAAWSARGEAAGGAGDAGYRPRTLAEARASLGALEERVARGDEDPVLQDLDGAGTDLEDLRDTLDGLEPALAPADLPLAARARRLLGDVERRLRAIGGRVAPGGAAAEGLELALARGWARYGDPERRERWLDAALARHGQPVRAEVERVRAACAEEARLLRAASPALEAAAARRSGDARARLQFLAGDAARRAGAAADARRALTAVVAVDPAGRFVGPARALLAP
jgi:hypothetical protein